ncbi:helicase-exonuclease AddAB subunit AddA [Diplocloster agilis]|uniref:helicase-exonuclease AddAB subunit AddA n=1 Tax=Diplocloster agilis TaxID=2850323 RepID=UPI0008224098|nr:helicase-exonuclease AddAB subunit AddA [Suonthocola fibrivorans]MCU6732727.1 helicase-exonuclease AddAB subunit AddA [Suonthocola fibrivorans]SCI58403.1 ATP-dependent helicase/nuclease subunit A [uncultured Clostridium sp.]
MGFSWTEEQQRVLDARKKNVLVSAAAGSGKTAVLVERIIRMVTDPEDPVDIDRLLIVTFTNAAAAEMRERITKAIESRLEEQEGNGHLQRQLTLIHNAQISTIDSFCLYVIRNYFHVIELDPNFRVADEGELKLLKSDVAAELLEECYEKGEEDFLHFVECYSTGKSDKGLEELILQLYEFSMSYPWPKEWLSECAQAYRVGDSKELEESLWMGAIRRYLGQVLAELKEQTRQAVELIHQPDGPYMYEDALQGDMKLLDQLCGCGTYLEYAEAFENLVFVRLSSKKDANVSDEKRQAVKEGREQIKKVLKGLKEQFFYSSAAQVLLDIQNSRENMEVLMGLVLDFSEKLSRKKKEKNLVDFPDLEHYALEILVERTEDGWTARPAAEDLKNYFTEIMIDEYQDSNLVQEMILNSISREKDGHPNIFMVGDVKQSIYRFRLARPELFMEKYDTYSKEDHAAYQRIDLHRNFRSRLEVIDCVNFIFQRIMSKTLGNVEYDGDAALYPGADYPEAPCENQAELLLLDPDSPDEMEEETEANARELEARAVAGRILELKESQKVWDRDLNEYRPARYSDMVILLRTVSGWAQTFTQILLSYGIPAHTSSQTGYFSTLEVQVVLNLLRLIDNPRQDLPLASVLKSPVAGLCGEDLALIKSAYPSLRFYECCEQYALGPEGEEVQEAFYGEKDSLVEPLSQPVRKKRVADKLRSFYRLLESFREKVPYTAIHELLWQILRETGYGDCAAAMPGGAQRLANLNMLVEKALDFEKTSYRGLFHFIRYIEQLQKYDVDFGEASLLGENEDAVRIMSIHKSKGLEFPIVFVSGMGKSFNKQDVRSKIVIHPDLGVGADYVDPALRVKTPTLIKKAVQRQTDLENLGEELRVLYVALTRAKEKLIMTGAVKKLAERLEAGDGVADESGGAGTGSGRLSFLKRTSAGSYLDWILPVALNSDSGIEIKPLSLLELVGLEARQQVTQKLSKEALFEWDPDEVYDPQLREILEKRLNYQYPYRKEAALKAKLSVSEIKRMGQYEADEPQDQMYEEPDIIPLLPQFIQKEGKEMTSAQRGTVYHKALECLEYQEMQKEERIRERLRILAQDGILTPQEIKVVDVSRILLFGKSSLAKRMAAAEKEGRLWREQQFVLEVPAAEVYPDYQGEAYVLIQGIIDVYFQEEDQLVVADYKSDRIRPGREGELAARYQVQLNYYQRALEQLTGKKVKEKLIYSLEAGKEIRVL